MKISIRYFNLILGAAYSKYASQRELEALLRGESFNRYC